MSGLDSPTDVTSAPQHWEALAQASARGAQSAEQEVLLELLTLRLADDTYAVHPSR